MDGNGGIYFDKTFTVIIKAIENPSRNTTGNVTNTFNFYLFKVIKTKTEKRCEIYSRLTEKAAE